MKHIFVTLLAVLLGVSNCHAQKGYLKTSIGLMSPIRRTFAGVEIGKVIASRYSIGLAGEVSATESNVSPRLTYSIGRMSLSAGMGWGHRWQKEGCNDHNYHTYTLGAYWYKPIRKRCSIYFGGSAFWRSYQAHIGLHRGSLEICTGLSFDI